MDKYIRTNNQIIEITKLKDLTSEKYVNDCIQSGFKTSDKIEDLCDAFVVFDNNGNPQVYKPFDVILWESKNKLFGAIWVDQGLVYVAKMNDKGEFELL